MRGEIEIALELERGALADGVVRREKCAELDPRHGGSVRNAVATLAVVRTGAASTGNRELLAGGYRNRVWKVRAGRGYVIQKQYADDPSHGDVNPMFPNLPDHEAMALRALGPLGLAPELLAVKPGSLTYRYVAGPTWRPGRLRAVDAVARLLGAVHAVTPPTGMRDLCASADAARAHGDSMVDATPSRFAPELRGVRPSTVGGDPVARASLVHTDCGPGNIVRGPRGLVLIDWQCPGAGDPVEDVACFLSPAMMVLYQVRPHSRAARAQFLSSYADADVVDRYLRDGAAWHYRIGAYCVWRAHRLARSSPDVAGRYLRALAAEIELLEGWR